VAMTTTTNHAEAISRYTTAKGYTQSCKIVTHADLRGFGQIDTILASSMLLAFALELYLKAWLLGSGRASDEVRSYGHRLADLYAAALSKDLPRVESLGELVDHFAGPHKDFTFRYMDNVDEISVTNWAFAYGVLEALDLEIDDLLGASAEYGLRPGH
jgi:hypothetical protein